MQTQKEFDTKRLAECLISFFKLMPNENQINRFVVEIAKQTLKKLEAGRGVEISTKDIFLEMFPNGDESQASSKLANLWKKLPALYENISIRLAEHAVNEFELDAYARPEKLESEGGAGNSVRYRLNAIKVNKELIAEPNPYREKIPHDIEYRAVQDFQPSIFAKLFFGKANEAVGIKKWVMIFTPIIQSVFYLFMVVVLFYALKKQTIATISFFYLSLFLAAIWLLSYQVIRFQRFTEDRIIIASEYFMSWKEFSLLQEIVTVEDENGNFLYKKIQLTKYVGVCPICNSRVELAKGEPDFPRRIIGRCYESPTEHIYSFDRITKLGYALRNYKLEAKSGS